MGPLAQEEQRQQGDEMKEPVWGVFDSSWNCMRALLRHGKLDAFMALRWIVGICVGVCNFDRYCDSPAVP